MCFPLVALSLYSSSVTCSGLVSVGLRAWRERHGQCVKQQRTLRPARSGSGEMDPGRSELTLGTLFSPVSLLSGSLSLFSVLEHLGLSFKIFFNIHF